MKFTKYIPLGLFALYAGKLLILGGSLESALILAVLASASAYYEFKSQDQALTDLQAKFKAFEDKLAEQDKAHESLKTHIHGLKIATSMKTMVR